MRKPSPAPAASTTRSSIGGNEPGSVIDSRTRRAELAASTRLDAQAGFSDLAEVPTHTLTMGCRTIRKPPSVRRLKNLGSR